jgi:hypothetical protein
VRSCSGFRELISESFTNANRAGDPHGRGRGFDRRVSVVDERLNRTKQRVRRGGWKRNIW